MNRHVLRQPNLEGHFGWAILFCLLMTPILFVSFLTPSKITVAGLTLINGLLILLLLEIIRMMKKTHLELRKTRDELETRVQERTRELKETNRSLEELIAHREWVERQLQESQKELADFLENAAIGMHWAAADGTILWANRAELEMLGFSREDYVGRNISSFHTDSKTIEDILKRLQNGETLENYEARLQAKDGSVKDVLITVNVLWKDNQFVHTRCFTRDITDRKKVEEALKTAHEELELRVKERTTQLAQVNQALLAEINEHKEAKEKLQGTQLQLIEAAKLESVGRLSAGVAHEVKNPLAIILMGIEYLSKKVLPGKDHEELVILDIRNAVKRADVVIKGLLDYASPKSLDLIPGNINAVIEQSLLLVKHALDKNHIAVSKELEADLPLVLQDANKLEHVFVNLITNAIDAMPEGGTLNIRTGSLQTILSVPLISRFLKRNGAEAGDVYVELEDTGTGISPEHLNRIYDPFFTTKPTGKGTGLGLAVTKSIVELHRGGIQIRNRKEGGVRVTIVLKSSKGGDWNGKETDSLGR